MNLLKSKLSVAIAAGLLSGSALAAEIACPITPAYSIITEGQTLQLTAECTGGVLASIDWKMDETSVTGVVPLTGYAAGNPIKYTTPVGLGDANETQEFTFTVEGEVGTPGDTFVSTPATVVVKPSSAVVALAKGVAIDPSAPTRKVDAECGEADGDTVPTMPASTAQCATGSTVTLPVSGPQYFTWSCLSLTGGAEASCYATREGYAPVEQPATVNGACGSANNGSFSSAAPPTNLCSTSYGNTSPVVTGSTYTWSCNGSNTAVTTDDTSCSAKIITSGDGGDGGGGSGGSGGSGGDTGIGNGLWVPPGISNRTVADQSSSSMSVSYVPGCLNGQLAKDSSSGCAVNDNYSGVRLGSGKELVLRYKTPSSVTNGKNIKVGAWNGGNVGVNMRIWLSKDPTATYASVPEVCKASSSASPSITTGAETRVTTTSTAWGKTTTTTKDYCKLDPNAVYYLGIAFDEARTGSGARFQVDEMSADFLP